MWYDIHFNPLTNKWYIWKVFWNGASQEMIKEFKTEKGAKNWVQRHS